MVRVNAWNPYGSPLRFHRWQFPRRRTPLREALFFGHQSLQGFPRGRYSRALFPARARVIDSLAGLAALRLQQGIRALIERRRRRRRRHFDWKYGRYYSAASKSA